jgi:hypothetical protein
LKQLIVAAELTQEANDFLQLAPMRTAMSSTLAAAGIPERPGTLLADSGHWSIANLTQIPNAPELLIPPPRHGHHGKPRKDGRPSEVVAGTPSIAAAISRVQARVLASRFNSD